MGINQYAPNMVVEAEYLKRVMEVQHLQRALARKNRQLRALRSKAAELDRRDRVQRARRQAMQDMETQGVFPGWPAPSMSEDNAPLKFFEAFLDPETEMWEVHGRMY